MTERKLFKTILLTVARPNQMIMSGRSVFFSLPVRKFEFSNENKTFDFMWTRLEREVCVQENICLSKKMSRNQSCIKINWEFWEVLRATRTKRNVTSVVLCFLSLSYLTFCLCQTDQQTLMSKSIEEVFGSFKRSEQVSVSLWQG